MICFKISFKGAQQETIIIGVISNTRHLIYVFDCDLSLLVTCLDLFKEYDQNKM